MASLYDGLKKNNPKAADASTVPKGSGSVNDSPTRDTVGKGTSLGGREA